MAIVEEDLERLRATVSISDVVQQHIALRRVGRNWIGLCPFHAERSPSFNVREETGRYKCFGCGAAGDVFTFVQEIEHVDFVTAVEQLSAKVGIQLRYTSGGESKDRQRRKQLIEAMGKAVEWYHQRLLTGPDGRAARDYLRSRGLAGDIARQFKLGWAPDDWDAMSRDVGLPADALRDTGLAFTNKSGRLQDSFRGRVMFPIMAENGDPVAFGGRILPGSTDPAKYKNSAETYIYAKSKTLYGLHGAKGDIVAADQVIVCEGYTDVIGFHRAGVKRAVATCGTALTEEHVRMLKRFASRVVLAFDADAAGQGAAEKFYEWEQKYQVQVSVAAFPKGQDPGELSVSDPAALAAAVDSALPFLGFRLQTGDDRATVALAGGSGAARRAGNGGGQRTSRHQRAQAVRRPGGQPHRSADQRSGGHRIASQFAPHRAGRGRSAGRQLGERRVRGDRPAAAALARHGRLARRGAVRRRCRSSRLLWPSPKETAPSGVRSSWPTLRRAS